MIILTKVYLPSTTTVKTVQQLSIAKTVNSSILLQRQVSHAALTPLKLFLG